MDRAAVDSLLRDYIALYTRDSLPKWRELFSEHFTATSANADRSLTSYTLDEFYARQQALFAAHDGVAEVLEHPQVQLGDRLGFVRSDYAWTDGVNARRGHLMMLIVTDRDTPRIQALTFAYD